MYKRNQIEEAISKVLESKQRRPSPVLLTRIKRLLDTDRVDAAAPIRGTAKHGRFAFFAGPAPGTGYEVRFSDYHAFALLTGLRLMAHGWTQGFTLSILRRCKTDLVTEHHRILDMDAARLFDEEEIQKAAKPGDFAVDNASPSFLVVVSRPSGGADHELLECAVQDSAHNAMRWAWSVSKGIHSLSLFELVSPAHRLAIALSKTEPRKRGRSF